MITDEEREQLTILDEQEADFYAGLLFLALARTRPPTQTLAEVREIVAGAYVDTNARIEEDPPEHVQEPRGGA